MKRSIGLFYNYQENNMSHRRIVINITRISYVGSSKDFLYGAVLMRKILSNDWRKKYEKNE